MKLIFSKDDKNEIGVQLQKGTIAVDFSYIEMVKQLLHDPKFNDCEYLNLTEEEEAKIKEMLSKIELVFKEDREK